MYLAASRPSPDCVGHIRESSVPVVVIKRILARVGDEDVRPAVVVVIARCDAVAVVEVLHRRRPAFAVTSSNVPSPLLRSRQL